jgi:hypothetical protein
LATRWRISTGPRPGDCDDRSTCESGIPTTKEKESALMQQLTSLTFAIIAVSTAIGMSVAFAFA